MWSRDTGQRIPCFDRCQLIITWMFNTKEVNSKPRLHVSLSTCYLEYGRHVARLCRRRRAYAPTSNTASHDNHEKLNSWVSFCFPHVGCLWGSAIKWEIVLQVQKHIHAVFCLNLFRGWYKVLASFLEVWMKKI